MERITAIIADDVPEMQELLSGTLAKLKIEVIATVDNGIDALELILFNKPGLCFIDIDMPKMNGLEVLGQLRKHQLTTYPVIVSGHSTASNVKEALEAGAKGFIVKPYSFDKVRQIIDKYRKSCS